MRRGRSAAVVGQREDVGAQVGPARDERRLGVRFEIAREQHATRAGRDADGERARVPRAVARPGRRPQRLDQQISRSQRWRLRAPLGDLDPVGRCDGEQRAEGRVGASAVGQPERRDGDVFEHGRNTAAVIQVGVRHDQQIQASDAERRERGSHHASPQIDTIGRRRSRIHEHGAAPPLHQQRVALPHVEGHQPRQRRGHRRGGRHGEQRARGEAEQYAARRPSRSPGRRARRGSRRRASRRLAAAAARASEARRRPARLRPATRPRCVPPRPARRPGAAAPAAPPAAPRTGTPAAPPRRSRGSRRGSRPARSAPRFRAGAPPGGWSRRAPSPRWRAPREACARRVPPAAGMPAPRPAAPSRVRRSPQTRAGSSRRRAPAARRRGSRARRPPAARGPRPAARAAWPARAPAPAAGSGARAPASRRASRTAPRPPPPRRGPAPACRGEPPARRCGRAPLAPP